MSLYLGVDIGTQGAKAVVYNATSRRVVSKGSHSYDLIPTTVPGRAEQHPSTWIQGGCQAIKQALSSVDPLSVKAIGVSGQQHGLVALDASGKVLRNAKLWCDTETAPEAAELSKMLGKTIVPGFTAPKILWLKRHEPDVYDQLAHVLLPHDYFNYFLTGQMAMECGDASGTGLFDTPGRTWDESAMDVIDPGLKAKLPQLIGPHDVVGTVKADVAAELGLEEDVIVAPGSGDNMMSALGAGVVRDGQMVISLGTSGTLFGKSSKPIVDPTGAIAPFCDATGEWLPLLCTLNCTSVPQEVSLAWGMDHDQLTTLAESEPTGCNGLTFLPYLAGERTPNWPAATGTVLGLRLGSLRPGLLYRAAMEGPTFGLLAGLKDMQAKGLTPTEVRVVGGGSKNKLWRQIIADSFHLPLKVPLEPESAALGGALQAAAVHQRVPIADFICDHQPPVSEEVVEPNEAAKSAYEAAFELYLQRGKLLFGS